MHAPMSASTNQMPTAIMMTLQGMSEPSSRREKAAGLPVLRSVHAAVAVERQAIAIIARILAHHLARSAHSDRLECAVVNTCGWSFSSTRVKNRRKRTHLERRTDVGRRRRDKRECNERNNCKRQGDRFRGVSRTISQICVAAILFPRRANEATTNTPDDHPPNFPVINFRRENFLRRRNFSARHSKYALMRL